MIAIIDYGAGNLRSISNALQEIGIDYAVLKNRTEFKSIDRILLPGVGSFGKAVQQLEESGFVPLLKEWLEADMAFLGICLGLQLLMDESDESPDEKGLGYIKGMNRRFADVKVPHIGWNNVHYADMNEPIFSHIEQDSYFYFVHSYYVKTCSQQCTIGETNYGLEFPSVLRKGNVYGVQFHPEKSGPKGLRLLQNWAELC